MGPVSIGHQVLGGTGSLLHLLDDRLSRSPGAIISGGALSRVAIGGSLVGGAFGDAGEITSVGAMGLVKIAQNLDGGAGTDSGLHSIHEHTSQGLPSAARSSAAAAVPVTNSGAILSNGAMGLVKIAHDLQGGGGASDSGEIDPDEASLAGVSIGGSLIGGSGGGAGSR